MVLQSLKIFDIIFLKYKIWKKGFLNEFRECSANKNKRYYF